MRTSMVSASGLKPRVSICGKRKGAAARVVPPAVPMVAEVVGGVGLARRGGGAQRARGALHLAAVGERLAPASTLVRTRAHKQLKEQNIAKEIEKQNNALRDKTFKDLTFQGRG